MFLSDKPIENSKKDRLNRTAFSKQLAQAILSYTQQDNFTISLCGKWGTGKTSILNMVIEAIREKTEEYESNKKPIIVFFNPWNYSDRSQLISQFFQTVQSAVESDNANASLKVVGLALQKYSTVLEYTSYIPVVGQYLQPIKSIVSGIGEHISGVVEENESLVKQKEKVIRVLKEQEQKIIVIIDDIDRLNNEQIRLIFQLVNSLAGFPNMIYLLSFDSSVVVRALEEEQKCNGAEYLEKIIQVPFEVPNAKISLVHKAFFDMLDEIILQDMECDKFNQDYWSSIFTNCISPFINSVRDVNRVINVFKFKYGLMHNETNWIDLLALTTLQICASSIFSWIYDNIDCLAGSLYNNNGTTGIEQSKNKESALTEFESIYAENPKLMLQVVQALFPKFSWKTGGHNCYNDTREELRRKQKVACTDRAPFYFSLSLEDVAIPKQQIQSSIIEYDSEELDEYINKLIKEEKLTEYLNELISYIKDIPDSRLRLFLDKLIGLQTLNELNKRKSFEVSPAYRCMNCCWAILNRLDKERIENELISILDSTDINSFSVVIEMFVNVERSYGRIGTSTDYDYRIVDEDRLPVLEKHVLKKIKELSDQSTLLDTSSFISIYFFWNYIEKESMNEYIIKMLEEPKNVPKYLRICASHWTGGKSSGWDFKEESFSEYISATNAYEKILSLRNTSDFSSLKFEIKEIALAYYLWYASARTDHYEISKEAVDSLIFEWEYK